MSVLSHKDGTPDRTIVTVLTMDDGSGTEIQWTRADHDAHLAATMDGYALIHGDGKLTVLWHDDYDEPYVFMLKGNSGAVFASEDQPPDLDTAVWRDNEPR